MRPWIETKEPIECSIKFMQKQVFRYQRSIAKGNPIAIEDVNAQDNELCEYWDYQNQILDSD